LSASDQAFDSATAAARRGDRALALLLGLHGLALMVVFPFGPQASRLWEPGVPGIGLLAAAFPLAAVLGLVFARRVPRLPDSPRALAVLACLATLPCALAFDYPSLVLGRLLSGFVIGASYVAIHRLLRGEAAPLVARLAPRVIAFGMPVCLTAAGLLDWHYAFVPLIAGYALVAWLAGGADGPAAGSSRSGRSAHGPRFLPHAATATLAFVSAAYLTVLSGFLVFNAGHTELHIPCGLLLGALLGLGVVPVLDRLRARLSPARVFAAALVASLATLGALLLLRSPIPAAAAVSAIGFFIAATGARHLALARLVQPTITPESLRAFQLHTHLAHHLGSGLGALAAGMLIVLDPATRTLEGMPGLLLASLVATGLALVCGLAAARSRASTNCAAAQASRMPSPAEISPSEIRAAS
jgi:predicted MFS family arabinose efflux permease